MPAKYTPEQRIIAFWNKVAIASDDNQCWIWLASKTDGYGNFGYNGKIEKAHRIAWSYPNYVIPKGMEICHSCDNPSCCNPKHLFLGTHQDNMTDMVQKGRLITKPRFGENSNNHKLTDIQVVEIRSRYSQGDISMKKLGQQYGVTASQVCLIVNHKQRTQ